MSTEDALLAEYIANARAILKTMSPTDMRVLIEEIGTSSTTGMTTSQLKKRLMQMAHDCDWMPDLPKESK
jgi:hypothetical protein